MVRWSGAVLRYCKYYGAVRCCDIFSRLRTCCLPDKQYVYVIYGGTPEYDSWYTYSYVWVLYYNILWNIRVRSDFMLPRVDGGHTWINYGIYSVLNFLSENWRKKASRWFVSSLSPPSSVNWHILVCLSSLHLSFEAPQRRLISLSSVRADPACEAIHYILRCGSVLFWKIENPRVRFSKIVNASVWFGAFMYRTVLLGVFFVVQNPQKSSGYDQGTTMRMIMWVVTPGCAPADVVSAVVLRRPAKEYTHRYPMMHRRLTTAGNKVAPHYHQLLV